MQKYNIKFFENYMDDKLDKNYIEKLDDIASKYDNGQNPTERLRNHMTNLFNIVGMLEDGDFDKDVIVNELKYVDTDIILKYLSDIETLLYPIYKEHFKPLK